MNAIITGARRGIGRAIVEKFAMEGMNIWACARKEDAAFEEDMAAISEKYKVRIKPVYFDMTDENGVKNGIKEIIKEKEPIDVLVNNAGYMPSIKGITMTSLDEIKNVMQVNTLAPIIITQLVLRSMLRTGKGVILNIASTAGMEATEGYSAYAMSKAALISFTQTCAAELAKQKIRVNAIAPGLTDTDLGQSLSPEATEHTLLKARMGRKGIPEEIAQAAYFLVSDTASFITGQVLRVDGGAL